MNGYNLTRKWYNYKFENPDRVKARHSDMFFYIVDLWNRLGQKEKFGLPTSITMEVLGIGSYNTYKKTLQDLIDFGFIKEISKSVNQHQSRIIALSKFDEALDEAHNKAPDKALDKAHNKAPDSIIEQYNNETKEQSKNAREEKNSTDKISEKEFLTLWAEIRESYDKKPSYFKKLNFYEKQKFEKLKDEYDEEEFKEAITGLFMQKNMFESNRVRPNHFLENFDTYRDCFHNKTQLFENPKPKFSNKPTFDINR